MLKTDRFQTKAQRDFLDDIAADFNFESMNELAKHLGYSDPNHLALARFDKSSIYECMTSVRNTSYYLQIHLMLEEG